MKEQKMTTELQLKFPLSCHSTGTMPKMKQRTEDGKTKNARDGKSPPEKAQTGESNINGHMIAKVFSVFTIIVPKASQERMGLLPNYTMRIQFNPANNGYKDIFFLQMLDNTGEATKYKYVAIFNPGKPEPVCFTAKSPFSKESFEGQLFSKILTRIFNGEPCEFQQHGFDVIFGLPSEAQATPEPERETIPGTSAMEIIANILH